MARQVLPIVGAAIDIYLGGTGQIGYAIGSCEGEAVDPEGDPIIGAVFGGPAIAELVYSLNGSSSESA